MVPLRVECRLAGPWCPPAFGMHLDGLLAWAMIEDARSSGAQLHDYDSVIRDLPLAKDADSGAWCASLFSVLNWQGQERRYMTAKTPVEHMASLIGKGVVETKGGSTIDTVRGIGKNGQVYITIEHAQGLIAWCIGDPDAIVSLLSRVTAVGVKSRIGLGSLMPFDDGSLWSVTEAEQAHNLWRRRSSRTKLSDDSELAVGAWKPPYWRGTEVVWRPPVQRIYEPAGHATPSAA